jgi:anti-sigma factor RsiW
MLCNDFQNGLTDYLEGMLEPDVHRTFAEHALRCPVCHETLTEVKNTMQACRAADSLEPPRELEARILLNTMPETAMTCADFEEFLTDYLDGFLPASLYHRWERHAVLCERCTELPGEVVRAIGTCYIYLSEEQPIPAGLNERILQATSGTELSAQIRASLSSRVASWLRVWPRWLLCCSWQYLFLPTLCPQTVQSAASTLPACVWPNRAMRLVRVAE